MSIQPSKDFSSHVFTRMGVTAIINPEILPRRKTEKSLRYLSQEKTYRKIDERKQLTWVIKYSNAST